MLFDTNKAENYKSLQARRREPSLPVDDQPMLFEEESELGALSGQADTDSYEVRCEEQAREGVEAAALEASVIEEASVTEEIIVDANNNNNAFPIALNSLWVTQENGEQFHLKHFLPQSENGEEDPLAATKFEALPGAGRRVFMLHGEVESGRVYYDSKGKGLAWYLARQGYEVFVADLGGRGRSLLPDGEVSSLSVHQIIHSALPKLLQAIANAPKSHDGETYFGCGADIWVGHGFGAVLLSAAWSSMPEYLRTAQQMIFFSGRRRVAGENRMSRLFAAMFGHPLMQRWVSRCNSFPAKKLGIGSANESVGWYANYLNWMNNTRWLSEEGEDYAKKLAAQPLPPTLHLAAQNDSMYASLNDVRSFVEELGAHDARLMVYDAAGASGRSYNHLSMLLDACADGDVFPDIAQWIEDTNESGFLPVREQVSDRQASGDFYADRYETDYDRKPAAATVLGNDINREEFQFA